VLRNIPGAGMEGVEGQLTGPQTGKPGVKKLSDKKIARPWYGLPAPTPEEVKIPAPPQGVVASSDFIEALGYIVPYSLNQLRSQDFGQITGMAMDKDGKSARIVHSEYGQPGLIYGDTIYINRGLSHDLYEGDVFLAFRPIKEVYHPITSELIGTQIDILGRLRVKNLEPEISAADIVKSYSYMQVGDPIMPVSELSLPLAKPFLGDSRTYGIKVGNQLIAHIISERSGRHGISEGDSVFIDVGAAQGIQPADSFIIYREIGKGYPRQAIGRIVILSVQQQNALALVKESVKTIEIGEKVVLAR
jgi:hypothetical protein